MSALAELEVWVLCSESGFPVGFMGMSGNKIEALFPGPGALSPRRRPSAGETCPGTEGGAHVDVNEQNPAARLFYEACGFVVEGRSELDSNGLPFPLSTCV